MIEDTKMFVAFLLAGVIGITIIAVVIHLGNVESQETQRACIQQGHQIIVNNCVR